MDKIFKSRNTFYLLSFKLEIVSLESMRSFEACDNELFVLESSVLLLINSFRANSNDDRADPRLDLS